MDETQIVKEFLSVYTAVFLFVRIQQQIGSHTDDH